MDRKAHSETQLEVDEAILDYLIYTAIISLLKVLDTGDNGPRKGQSARSLVQMVDAFLPTFRSIHPKYKASPEIQLRLRLLQFTYVFVQHYHPTITNSTLSRGPSSSTQEDRIDPSSANPLEQEDPSAMSLDESLDHFIALSALQNNLQGSTVTEIWMVLAAGYMAQAYIEQVVVYQNEQPNLLEETFIWGWTTECLSARASKLWQFNELFGADDERSYSMWESIKEQHVLALRPPERPRDRASLVHHLESLASGPLSVVSFKAKISEFLTGLLSAYEVPLLIQLERGEIAGLSRKATKALKIRSGFIHLS
ncbi:MAG: hypothetical protein Q9168_002224 [Polycauliona sp. 1 TL-2023]